MKRKQEATECTHALTWCSRHGSLQCSVSVGLVANQFGQLVPASQQLLQTLHQIVVGVEVDPVGDLSHLTVAECRKKNNNSNILNRNKNSVENNFTQMKMILQMEKATPADRKPEVHKSIPGHRGNLRADLRLGRSSPRWQTAGAGVRGWRTGRFCWACGSRPGTRCSGPTAWCAAPRPPSSADGRGCSIQREAGPHIWRATHTDRWRNPTSLSSRWIPLISKSNMKSSATRLGKTSNHSVISHRTHKGKRWTWVKHGNGEMTLCRGPAEPQRLGRPAVASGFGTAPRWCSAWYKQAGDVKGLKPSATATAHTRCLMLWFACWSCKLRDLLLHDGADLYAGLLCSFTKLWIWMGHFHKVCLKWE